MATSQKETITKGSTDYTVHVNLIQDNSGTNPGDPLTGLVYNSASLVCYYKRGATGALTQLTLATQTPTGAHSDGGFVEISSSNAPGLYRLDLSDVIVSSGAESAIVILSGYADLVPHIINIDLESIDRQDSVRAGLTALPNAAADAAGGLPISDAGGLDLDTILDAAISTRLSLNATATSNLEDQYDGTGLSGDTYPATQQQVGAISVASAAINEVAESYTLTTGTQTANTYTATTALDNTRHTHTDSAGAMELYYQFDIGNSGIPVSAKMTGALTGNNDTLGVYAYNWAGASWDQVGSLVGLASSVNSVHDYDLLSAHVGTGSDIGKVRIRFYAASGLTTATLYVDQLFVSYAQASGGIANGSAVTLTTSTTNTNLIGRGWTLALGGQDISGSYIYQSIGISGTATVSNGSPYIIQECQFNTVSLSAFGYIENSAFADTATFTSTSGVSADALDIFNSKSNVAGSGSPTLTFASVTKSTNVNIRNWFGGGTWIFTSNCTASIEVPAGGSQTITTGGGNIELRGAPKAVNITSSGSGTSNIVVWSGCPVTISGTGGTVNLYGVYGDVTLGSPSGSVTINYYPASSAWDVTLSNHLISGSTGSALNDALVDTGTTIPNLIATAQADLDIITGSDGVTISSASESSAVDAVWDEVLNAATHNVASSAGRRLRQVTSVITHEGTAQGPGTGNNQIQLSADASSTDGAYDPSMIAIVGGTGAGQARYILEYNGTTKVAVLGRDWKDNPDATSQYIVIADAGRMHVNEGLAQGGTSNSITLNSLASSTNDVYKNQLVFIVSGTGADQSGLITAYNGTTKVATIDGTWPITPDTTSGYLVSPSSPVALLEATQTQVDNLVTYTTSMKNGIIEGSTQAGTLSTTQATTNLTGYTDDQLIGRTITFYSGNVDGEQAQITDYANTSGLITFDALTLAPDAGVTFKIT